VTSCYLRKEQFIEEVGPLNLARRLGERCKLPSGVWVGAPAEIEFAEKNLFVFPKVKWLHLTGEVDES